MHSAPALLEGNVALAGRSQKRFYAAQRKASCLKTQGDIEKHSRRQRTNRLVATNHNVNDVDWLRDLNENIAWIKGDPIEEISQQLKQNKKIGKTINELHIVAHGSNGDIKLGNAFLTKQHLEKSSALLQEWKLEAIYLWSCEAGLNVDLITVLQECTGADIYSSETRISREKPNIYSKEDSVSSLEELIDSKQLQQWEGTLFAAPLLGKESSSYEEISIDIDNALSPPAGVTITARNLVFESGSVSLSSASSSHVSTHVGPNGFGVSGPASGNSTEIGYHSYSGLSEQLIIEFDEIVYTIGFATAWFASTEGLGIYKMYREGTLVKTGEVSGITDNVDPPLNLTTDDGYGFDKIEFTAGSLDNNDYLIHKITYAKSNANNVTNTSINELDDASSQDIPSQTGSLSISDSDNAGTITASIIGDPIITLNGSTISLPASASSLTADGAMSLSPTSQTWGGSWTPITWTYDPTAADLDFIPAGQDLVIAYDIQLNDEVSNSNTVRVEVTIVGENDAPAISDATYILAEDTAAETIFHDTDEDSTGNDTDIESETISYSITAGNSDSIFSIDSNTGEISIAAGQSLDYETDNQHILTVKASDSTESNTANVTVNINNVRPKIAITDDDADNSLSKGDTSTITFTLTEASTDFVQSDVTASGGTLSNWNAASSTVYTATFTPTTNSTSDGVIHVANDKFSNAAANNNQDENDANNTVTLTVDTIRPTIAIISDVSSLKVGETAAISFTLSEASTNFIESDITVNGGTLSNFSGSGTSYSATFTPTPNSTSDGIIHVANDKFSDAAANNNQDENDANNTVTLTVDTVRPTIALSSDVTSLKAGETATIFFTLSEISTNFVESDITFKGGTLSNFSGSGTSYSATFTPTTDSTSDGVIHVANDKFSIASANNNQDENDANNTVTLTVDTVRPTIEQTENSQIEKNTTPKDLDESFDLGQTSATTPISSQINKESNQLLTTFDSDTLTNYYEFQPKTLFAQYNSLLGDSGGGGSQIPKSSNDGGTDQERGVRIIANSFCSTLDDSIIQHDASTNDTFFVVLTGAPTSGVTVSLKAPDSLQGMLSSDELYFTTENWNIPQKVTFSAESLGASTKDKRFKLIAIASKEGGYTGTENDSATFNNSENSIKQVSTEIKRTENPEEDLVNLDIERITAHEELSPMFTILRIISFPAIAFISFALNSIERFQSDISPSSQPTDQNNNHHQTSAFQLELIEVNHLHGIGSESDFRLSDRDQCSSATSSLLLAQMSQTTDCYF